MSPTRPEQHRANAPRRSRWSRLTDAEVQEALSAARLSVETFESATREHGSLIQSWIRGQVVVEYDHYPANDVVDNVSGSQYYYHCHRSGGEEHGHVHLFWHATRTGRRNSVIAGRRRWANTAPSHLFAISMDGRGLPVSLFTVNQWVTDGHWFDAEQTLKLVDRFDVNLSDSQTSAGHWLTHFVRMYRAEVKMLLSARDERLNRTGDIEAALQDRRLEVLSRRRIDWATDLDALEDEAAWRHRRGQRREAAVPSVPGPKSAPAAPIGVTAARVNTAWSLESVREVK